MTENGKLEDMCDSDNQRSNYEGLESSSEKGGHKTWVSDVVRGRSESNDSLVTGIEGLSQLIETDINSNSRITRNLTRKGPIRDTGVLSSSPRACLTGMITEATLYGGSTPEKSVGVAMGATDHAIVPQVHHQITITNGCVGAAESRYAGKRFGFRRSSSSPTRIIDSRMILFFFATLSCLGTILLIYFTLSMGKLGGEDNILD